MGDLIVALVHMKSLRARVLLSLLVFLNLVLPGLAGEYFLHDGDRVVFLGDSITEQRLYTTYIEAYALTRHPEWKLSRRHHAVRRARLPSVAKW